MDINTLPYCTTYKDHEEEEAFENTVRKGGENAGSQNLSFSHDFPIGLI